MSPYIGRDRRGVRNDAAVVVSAGRGAQQWTMGNALGATCGSLCSHVYDFGPVIPVLPRLRLRLYSFKWKRPKVTSLMNSNDIINAYCWYAIHTHLRQEERVYSNLSVRGVETFLPRIKERKYNHFADKVTYIIRPFFPRYIFAKVKIADMLHKISFTRGVHSVVGYGGDPAPINDEIISVIKSRTGEGGCIMPREQLAPGDEVIIEEGPLKSLRGIFERETNGADRVRILLKAISFQAHLVIGREMLKKASNA